MLILAPMDDVTDVAFRQVIDDCASPDVFFTEFVNVDGLCSAGRSKIEHKLRLRPGEDNLVAQIWGKTPANYFTIASELSMGPYVGIDINMGCPENTVVKNGCCSALINNRELAVEIIQAVKKGAGNMPVSVKTRLGFNEVDYTWHKLLLEQGIDMLTVHCRTRKEMSKVPANWAAILPIKKLRDEISPKTKLIINGDITDSQHAQQIIKEFAVDGAMIGRGVFHNPYAFAKDPSIWQATSQEDKISLYKKHILLFSDAYPERQKSPQTLKRFAKVYINGFEGASELRERLMLANSVDELLAVLATK